MGDVGKEIKNVGLFAAIFAAMYAVAKKWDKGFLGAILFRGRK